VRDIVRFDPRTSALYTPTSGSGIERADLAVGAPNPAAWSAPRGDSSPQCGTVGVRRRLPRPGSGRRGGARTVLFDFADHRTMALDFEQ
jgi:hypothetical protein